MEEETRGGGPMREYRQRSDDSIGVWISIADCSSSPFSRVAHRFGGFFAVPSHSVWGLRLVYIGHRFWDDGLSSLSLAESVSPLFTVRASWYTSWYDLLYHRLLF